MNPGKGTAILGHERQREVLFRALRDDHLHHAWLFEGPRGVGKSLVALTLAMASNCERVAPGTGEPCGACPTCEAIRRGTHPDVLWLRPDQDKAARSIPVEKVRETIRQLGYHRFSARARFVVIDPAEAMAEGAANALLKTLEEPPRGTWFVLITHNAAALLPTIRSRCQRMRFGSVPTEDVRRWLVDVHHRPLEVAAGAAWLSAGAPGEALALDAAAQDTRRARRQALCRALVSGGDATGELAGSVTQGARQDWSPQVDQLLDTLEELVRDAILIANGREVPEAEPAVLALARGWPDAPARCAAAIQDVRDDLVVFVSGKTALDAVLARVRDEVRSNPAESVTPGR